MFISSACKPVAPGDEVVVVSAKILRSWSFMDLYLSSQVALASFHGLEKGLRLSVTCKPTDHLREWYHSFVVY